MKIRMLTAALLMISPAAFANECAALNCDCAALEPANWQKVCTLQEEQLRSACQKAPKSQPGYCSVHGPKAAPLPLTFSPSSVRPESVDLELENRKIASLFWSLREDWKIVRGEIKVGNYSRATQLLDISDNNLDNVYKAQAAVAFDMVESKRKKKALRSWRDFAGDAFDLAKHWRDNLQSLQAPSESDAAKFTRFAGAAYGLLGQQFELAGNAYSEAEAAGMAAQAWKAAADAAYAQLEFSIAAGTQDKDLTELRHLAAARLNRASYYAMQGDNEKDAESLLRESHSLIANQKLIEEILGEAPQ